MCFNQTLPAQFLHGRILSKRKETLKMFLVCVESGKVPSLKELNYVYL